MSEKCEHDLAERETACADGMCPLCLQAEIAKLQAALDDSTAMLCLVMEFFQGEKLSAIQTRFAINRRLLSPKGTTKG